MKILAKIYSRELQQTLDPMKNVVTTIGAYEAMYAAFQALVNPGDEVGNLQNKHTSNNEQKTKQRESKQA